MTNRKWLDLKTVLKSKIKKDLFCKLKIMLPNPLFPTSFTNHSLVKGCQVPMRF